jgi:hypothetical protein
MFCSPMKLHEPRSIQDSDCRLGGDVTVPVCAPMQGRNILNEEKHKLVHTINRSLFHRTLYKQLVFDHTLMRKGRAIGYKIT